MSRITLVVAAACLLSASSVSAQDPLAAKVLVVYNTRYPDSVAVADHYIEKRQIPASNRCPIDAPSGDGWYIGGAAEYRSLVKTPVQRCLNAVGPDKILYIVFTYLTPDKVFDEAAYPMYATRAIDSLIADIWAPFDSNMASNPYLTRAQSAAGNYPPFVSLEQFRAANPSTRIYSVWRLDARTAAQSDALVDKAMTAEAVGIAGRGCFDRRYADPLGADTSYAAGDWDIQRSADFVGAAGFQVTLDTAPAEFNATNRCDGAAFYGGWYSYGNYNDAFTWAPGAMGWHLDSLSLWSPRDSTSWGGGAIEHGITMTGGAVSEPLLDFIPHLDTFYKDVLGGANVGDAMLRATEMLDWMIVNVGDPLYRPFRAAVPPPPPPPPTGDITAPVVTFAPPPIVSRKAKVTLRATATDDVGVVKLAILIDGVQLCSANGSLIGCVWKVPAASRTHLVEAVASDAVGNTTRAGGNVVAR